MIRNWGKLLAALVISGYICVMYEFMAGLRLVGVGLIVFALAMWYLYTVRRQIEMDGVEELKLAAKNDPAELCCTVRNTGILPVPFACLIVERQGEKKPQKYTFPLDGKGERIVRIPLDTSRAGVYRMEMTAIRLQDMLSLFSIDRKIGQMSVVIILPDLDPVLVEASPALQFFGEESAYSSGRRGADASDILGTREYEPGDRPQQIHWKLTQRTGELMVKEYGDPRRFGTALLLDASVITEPCLEALFSISLALGEARIPHFLCVSMRQGWERWMVYDEESARDALLELLQKVSGEDCRLARQDEQAYEAQFGVGSCRELLRLTEERKLYQNRVLLAELSETEMKQSLAGLRLQV
ncbi:MAG: DUF58 domain-containing protein [Lachnospiraceae bacterium]|nr:DUF58 domain-containing protein [Cuneatibacter sp.]MDD6456135.1 DUF58 domain-containing protein [Lachnospiraceae bacterium]